MGRRRDGGTATGNRRQGSGKEAGWAREGEMPSADRSSKMPREALVIPSWMGRQTICRVCWTPHFKTLFRSQNFFGAIVISNI